MSKRPGQDPQRRPTIGTTRNPPHGGPAEQVDVIVVKFVSPQDWQFVSSSKQKCSEARGRRRRGTGEGHRQAVAPGSLLAPGGDGDSIYLDTTVREMSFQFPSRHRIHRG